MTVLEFPSSLSQAPEAHSRAVRPQDSDPNVPPDAAERARALDIDRSWIVEAPAGSGKTGLLIQRYLKLLSIVDRPESVLALTFTNKATAEMRDRVLQALERADGEADPRWSTFDHLTWEIARAARKQDQALGWQLRAQGHRLNIRTIDSLCGEIARSVPVLSGGIGSATPVPDAADLYRQAARSVLLRFGGPDGMLNDAIQTVLLQRDGDLLDCERLLAEMLGTREQWGDLLPLSRNSLEEEALDREVLPRLNQALESVICNALSAVTERFPPHLLENLTELARRLAGANGYRDQPNPLRHCAALKRVPGVTAEDVPHWHALNRLLLTKDGTLRKQFNRNQVYVDLSSPQKAELQSLVDELRGYGEELTQLLCDLRDLPETPYPLDQWRVAKALFRLLHQALIDLRHLFAEREVCDFTELSIAARAALRNGEGTDRFAAGPGTELQHLLVDEMQDTSTSQYELLEALTSGWDGRTRTVFFVGDPKQSIYLFRQARVERFLEGMHSGRLGGMELGSIRLSANFRSGAALVESFNRMFHAVFAHAGAGGIGYNSAAPMREEAAGEAVQWHLQTWSPTQDAALDTAERRRLDREEAEAIAKAAYDRQRMPLPAGRVKPWKVAVLARSRGHVFQITRKLQEAGVPFRAVEMEHLDERPEVLDALALTRALLHPADRVAWLAVLRAPWCGLSLRELHLLTDGDNADSRTAALRLLVRERVNLLALDSRSRLLRTLDVLDTAVSQRGRTTLAVAVERLLASLGANLYANELARTNVRRYLELLEQMEARGEPVDAASVRKRVRKLYAEPAVTPGAVDVMTIHKSKGLEWDLVLLPGLHKLSARDDIRLLDWMELPSRDRQGRAQMLLAPVQARGDEPGSLNQFIRKSRLQHSRAELKRLLYVAATRARTSLQIFASPALTAAGTVEQRKDTLLFAAWTAVSTALQLPPAEKTPPVPKQPHGPVLRNRHREGEGLALAAGQAPDARRQAPDASRPLLRRLPLTVHARDRLRDRSIARPLETGVPAPSGFSRPEGSFGARAAGNTVHAFLEYLAQRIAVTPEAEQHRLTGEVQNWSPRIRAVLRNEGLPADPVERLTRETIQALTRTLEDDQGRWLLQPHRGAVSEAEIGAGHEGSSAHRAFRMDRSFFAGSAPREPGSDVLWIVDYKTSVDVSGDRQAFLAREQQTYEGQLRRYAELRTAQLPAGQRTMLALYYPMLPALHWWEYTPD